MGLTEPLVNLTLYVKFQSEKEQQLSTENWVEHERQTLSSFKTFLFMNKTRTDDELAHQYFSVNLQK